MQAKNCGVLAVAFGQLISKRRELLNLTQDGLANRLNVSRDVVNNVEKGRQDLFPEQLLAFAEGLRCTLAELMPDPEAVDKPDPNIRSIAYGGLVNNDEVLLKLLANYGAGGGNYLPGRESKSKR
jgi:transcriptional regulator with XRE-family HTH domain